MKNAVSTTRATPPSTDAAGGGGTKKKEKKKKKRKKKKEQKGCAGAPPGPATTSSVDILDVGGSGGYYDPFDRSIPISRERIAAIKNMWGSSPGFQLGQQLVQNAMDAPEQRGRFLAEQDTPTTTTEETTSSMRSQTAADPAVPAASTVPTVPGATPPSTDAAGGSGIKKKKKKKKEDAPTTTEETPSSKRYICTGCHKTFNRKLSRCSRCRSVSYCSPECQRADWKNLHKYTCQNLVNLAKQTTANADVLRFKASGRVRSGERKLLRALSHKHFLPGSANAPDGGPDCGPAAYFKWVKGTRGKRLFQIVRNQLVLMVEGSGESYASDPGAMDSTTFCMLHSFHIPHLNTPPYKKVKRHLQTWPHADLSKIQDDFNGMAPAAMLDFVVSQIPPAQLLKWGEDIVKMLQMEAAGPPHFLDTDDGWMLLQFYAEMSGNLHRPDVDTGYSLLHHAVRFECMKALQYLLAAGVNPNLPTARSNITNMSSASPPIILAGMYHAPRAFVALCRAPGIDLEVHNTSGKKALHGLIMRKDSMHDSLRTGRSLCSEEELEAMLLAYVEAGGDPTTKLVDTKNAGGEDASWRHLVALGGTAADLCRGMSTVELKWMAKHRVVPVSTKGAMALSLAYANAKGKEELGSWRTPSLAQLAEVQAAIRSGEMKSLFDGYNFELVRTKRSAGALREQCLQDGLMSADDEPCAVQ